jgi:hypothetical protein
MASTFVNIEKKSYPVEVLHLKSAQLNLVDAFSAIQWYRQCQGPEKQLGRVIILDNFDLRALPNPQYCTILVIKRRGFPGIW